MCIRDRFKDQPKNQLCVWVYGLFSDKPGDYVKKPMRDCTGREICMEWLYHIGVPGYLWNKLKKCIRQYNCYPIEINSTQEFAIFAESRNLNRNQNENGIDG